MERSKQPAPAADGWLRCCLLAGLAVVLRLLGRRRLPCRPLHALPCRQAGQESSSSKGMGSLQGHLPLAVWQAAAEGQRQLGRLRVARGGEQQQALGTRACKVA